MLHEEVIENFKLVMSQFVDHFGLRYVQMNLKFVIKLVDIYSKISCYTRKFIKVSKLRRHNCMTISHFQFEIHPNDSLVCDMKGRYSQKHDATREYCLKI
jgi:hypothetical protein